MSHYDDAAEAARAMADRQRDLANWRQHHPDETPPSVAEVLDDQARARSHTDGSFGFAWSLVAGGFAVMACDPAGRPLPDAQPMRDTTALLAAWDAHPGAVAAAACGREYDLVAAVVTDDEWLVEVSVDPATRSRPLPDPPPAVTIAPEPAEPDDARPGPQRRDLAATAVRLTEIRPAAPQFQTATSGPGGGRGKWSEDLAAKLRRPKPAATTLLVWSWPAPDGDRVWELPIGRRVRGGVELVRALPADGVEVTLGERRYRVAWGGGLARRLPLPSWLASEFGGRLRSP